MTKKEPIYSPVDFFEGKKDLEKFIEEEVKNLAPGEVNVHSFSVKNNQDKIVIKHFFEQENLQRECILDFFELFDEFYKSHSFEEKKVNLYMGKYNIQHDGLACDNQSPKTTKVEIKFNEKGTLIKKNSETKKLGPHVLINFTTQNLDTRDLEFNKEIYVQMIPEPEIPLLTAEESLDELVELGVIHEPDLSAHTWDSLAGYEKTKQEIINKVIRPNLRKGLFDKIKELTRKNPNQQTYNCILFSGTYGVGKTDMAKVVAHELGYHYFELPLQSVFTKWYGESGNKLGEIFDAVRSVKNSVLFLDEIDCIVGDRDGDLHEESKRVMSVLMTNTAKTKVGDGLVIIGATNKPGTIDGALLRRFKKVINFPLPSYDDMVKIYQHYAKHLDLSVIEQLAKQSVQFSPYDILDVCDRAEGLYLADYIANDQNNDSINIEPPQADYYFKSLGLSDKKKIIKPPMGFKR